MPEITFYAQGEPKGQPRPRAFGRGKMIRVYDPGTAEGWKNQIAVAAKEHIPASPLAGPLYVRLEFYFPRPRGHYRSGKFANTLKESAPAYQTSKPDIDNAIKAVLDALTILRFWNDDSQVCDTRCRKLYDDGRGPGCIVTIKDFIGS